MEEKRTYISYKDVPKRNQIEYTEKTKLLDENGNVLVRGGWARKDVFEYDRNNVKPHRRGKEWDFYQISNGKFMIKASFANISIGGYLGISLTDLENHKVIINGMDLFLGGRDKFALPAVSDQPHVVSYKVGKGEFRFEVKEGKRIIEASTIYQKKPVKYRFEMDILPNHENITTVLPFKEDNTKFFMTTKQNCMATEGSISLGDEVWNFSKEDTFTVLDWGRINSPYKLVWYWGNASTYIVDKDGTKHTFGFEITWGIGDESNATETALFFDGKLHKIGSVDVEKFPKNNYMEPWHIVSEDGRFDFTMTPTYDHHEDTNICNLVRMNAHQVHGRWSGKAVLDDGKVIEIEDMYAFCEYVENKW